MTASTLLCTDVCKERGNEALALHQLGVVQAHCHRGLGMLYAKACQQEQARAELSTAIDLYRAMDMTFWLPQAEAVLAQAGREEEPEGGMPCGVAPKASVGNGCP